MILQDKFTILNKNTNGSFMRAISNKDNKEVAIKKVPFAHMTEKEKKKLIEEVNILLNVKCNNIVRYYTYLLDKENMDIYIVMEYCSGGSLH